MKILTSLALLLLPAAVMADMPKACSALIERAGNISHAWPASLQPWDENTRRLNQVSARSPDQSVWHARLAQRYFSRYRALGQVKDWQQAQSHQAQWLALQPKDANAQAFAVSMALAKHDFPAARRHADAALKLSQDVGAWSAVFDARLESGDYVGADNALNKLDPNSFVGAWRQARWLDETGRGEAALQALARAVEHAEKSAMSPLSLAASHGVLGVMALHNAEYALACSSFRQAVALNPRERASWQWLARWSAYTGERAAAHLIAQQLTAAFPQDAQAFDLLAELAQQMGRMNEFAQAQARRDELWAEQADLYRMDRVAQWLEQPEQQARARSAILLELERRPAREVQSLAALVMAKQGHNDQAQEFLQQAQEFGVLHPPVAWLHMQTWAQLGETERAAQLREQMLGGELELSEEQRVELARTL